MQAKEQKEEEMRMSKPVLLAVLGRMLKRSLALHFQSYYLLVEVDYERDDAIWAGISDLVEFIDDRSAVELAAKKACVEFHSQLHLGWGSELDETIWQVFLFGGEEQRNRAGYAISRINPEEGVGPSEEGAKVLRELAKTLDHQGVVPAEIRGRILNVRAGQRVFHTIIDLPAW